MLASTYAQAQEVDPSQRPDGSALETSKMGVDTAQLGVEVRSLEEKVNALKEKVFKSKARLVLLRETVLEGVISSARAVITHRNDMGSSFRLLEMSYSLDGENLLFKTMDSDTDSRGKEVELFSGSIPAGTHNLSVVLVYRGHGHGLFTYLDAYQFKIKSSYPFTAEEGKQIVVKSIAYERGGITTELQRRPNIRFETSVIEDLRVPVDQSPSENPES